MRLINADKIVVNTFRNNSDGYKMWKTDFDGLLNIIDEQPTVDVLDKIRAEIKQEREGYPPSADYYKAIMKVLQIIDKYRNEVSS